MKFKRSKQQDPFSLNTTTPKINRLEDDSHKLEWTESSYIANQGDKESLRLTFDFSYLKLIVLVVIFFTAILLGRASWLQLVKGDHYSAMAQGNKIRIKSIEADRGIIFDRNGQTLVFNSANFMLYLVPGDLPREAESRDKILNEIIGALYDREAEKEKVKEEVLEKIESVKSNHFLFYEPLFLKDNIEYDKAMQLYLKAQDLPGVVLANQSRREYLNKIDVSSVLATSSLEILSETDWLTNLNQGLEIKSLSHLLGYTGKINQTELSQDKSYSPIDYIGKTGIEYTWENELKGVKGRKKIEVDALGKEKRVIGQEEPQDGNSLVLALDFELQAKTEAIVREYLVANDKKEASVVIMDPNTGEILTLISLPAFDNNMFARGFSKQEYEAMTQSEDYSVFNRTIAGEYPSGSVIKPVIAAAALNERVVSANTTVNSTGGIRIGQWFFPDWRAGGHGITDVRKAIAQSVNTFFYYIGGGYRDFPGLGLEKILEYDRKFGLGSKTGIDLPNESLGFLPSEDWKRSRTNEPWYIGDTYHLSIGQGFLLATPIQVANFTSVFANRGTLYKPHLVKEILNSQGDLIQEIEPETVRENFVDEYVMQVVREGMRQTVTSGSGVSLSTLGVTSAGKTGTAQWATGQPPHAWFTCFAPYDNPEITVTVLVEKGGEGHNIALPIAKEILDYYFDKPR